jgi:glycosyltransferase domain-containing protein
MALTIVLLLKDRHDYTLRWLSYARKMAIRYPIFVADGSSDDKAGHLVQRFKDDLNIHYQKFPYDTDYLVANKKIVHTFEQIKTKYSVVVDNDDFTIPEGLAKCVDFLEQHPDYVSCSGMIASLTIKHREAAHIPYGKAIVFNKRLYQNQRSLEETKPADRLQDFCTNYFPNFYDVFKSEKFLEIFRFATEINLTEPALHEYSLAIIPILRGKKKCLNTDFLIRDLNPSSGASTTKNKRNFFDRITNAEYLAQFPRVINGLSTTLKEVEHNLEDHQALVVENFKLLFRKNASKYFTCRPWTTNRIFNRLGRSIKSKYDFWMATEAQKKILNFACHPDQEFLDAYNEILRK